MYTSSFKLKIFITQVGKDLIDPKSIFLLSVAQSILGKHTSGLVKVNRQDISQDGVDRLPPNLDIKTSFCIGFSILMTS